MTPTDEQLLQDVEGVLELCCETPRRLQQAPLALTTATSAGPSSQAVPASPGHAPASVAHMAGMSQTAASTSQEPSAGCVPDGKPCPTASSLAEAQHGGLDGIGACQQGDGQNGASDHLEAAPAQRSSDSGDQSDAGWEAGKGQLGCRWLVACLELWDGACWLMRGRAKPAHWLAALMKAAKCFEPAVRAQAANLAQVDYLSLSSSLCCLGVVALTKNLACERIFAAFMREGRLSESFNKAGALMLAQNWQMSGSTKGCLVLRLW